MTLWRLRRQISPSERLSRDIAVSHVPFNCTICSVVSIIPLTMIWLQVSPISWFFLFSFYILFNVQCRQWIFLSFGSVLPWIMSHGNCLNGVGCEWNKKTRTVLQTNRDSMNFFLTYPVYGVSVNADSHSFETKSIEWKICLLMLTPVVF